MQIEELWTYLVDNELLSPTEIEYLKTGLLAIKEMSPSDKPSVFRKMEYIIEVSENVSWCIFALKQHLKTFIKCERQIKDPEYSLLVGQGRPSSEAINSEIRWKNESLYDLDYKISVIENTIEYINHIEQSLERYLYMLKDKLKNQ